MEKKSVLSVGLLIGVVAIVAGMVWSAEKDKLKGKEEENTQIVAMANMAKITIEQAIKTGADNFPGKVIEAELERKEGRTLWEVAILTAEQGIMVVHVDAESGSVITTEGKTIRKSNNREKSK